MLFFKFSTEKDYGAVNLCSHSKHSTAGHVKQPITRHTIDLCCHTVAVVLVQIIRNSFIFLVGLVNFIEGGSTNFRAFLGSLSFGLRGRCTHKG